MKSENNNFPEVDGLINELLTNAAEARHFYLKLDVIDKIISLFTFDIKQSEDNKWENLVSLQKRINSVKAELSEIDEIVLMQEVIEEISKYLNINESFREEALENVKKLTNIQKKKVKTLEHVFKMESDK